MREAQKEYDWSLNFGEIAQIWRGGCIIRAAFLQKITEAFTKNSNLSNLLIDGHFKECINKYQHNWRKVISIAIQSGIPVPTFPLHFHTMTATEITDSLKIYFRHKEIILVHTHMKGLMRTEENSFIWIGWTLIDQK